MPKEMIRFENVSKIYPKSEDKAVDGVSFVINEGEFITILGSSGSGKTTTLKMINRLIEADKGKVYFDDKEIISIDEVSLRRQIGYVVQQVALFPHLTVKENMALVPRLLGWEKERIEERLDTLFEMIHLSKKAYENRYPKALSGGQQQRVGLARALAANPKVILFDEPFGAIDAITRGRLQAELKALHQQLKDRTFVLVTHDINEAFFLGNRVMVMDEGKLCQFDTPDKIINFPKTPFVEKLIETARRQDYFWSKQS